MDVESRLEGAVLGLMTIVYMVRKNCLFFLCIELHYMKWFFNLPLAAPDNNVFDRAAAVVGGNKATVEQSFCIELIELVQCCNAGNFGQADLE